MKRRPKPRRDIIIPGPEGRHYLHDERLDDGDTLDVLWPDGTTGTTVVFHMGGVPHGLVDHHGSCAFVPLRAQDIRARRRPPLPHQDAVLTPPAAPYGSKAQTRTSKGRTRDGAPFLIRSDGRSTWVNGPEGTLARFTPSGWDVRSRPSRPPKHGAKYDTLAWLAFVTHTLRNHGILVGDSHLPIPARRTASGSAPAKGVR